MAKAFGGSRTAAATNGTPGGIRPMPRPAGLGGVEVEKAPRQGWMGPMTSDRYDMAMNLLGSAMSGASGSPSPALQFLAPILGAMTGTKLADKRDDAVRSEQAAMAQGLLGDTISPQVQQAMDVLNNPDAPDYLKSIALSMVKGGGVPFGRGSGSSERSGGRSRSKSRGGGGTRPTRLTYISRDPDGVVRGYNSATGKREPVPNSDETSPTADAGSDLPSLPALPPDPIIPGDRFGATDDELINKYLGK